MGRPRKEREPKVPKEKTWAEDPITYYRNDYQEKIKQSCTCENCGTNFTNDGSYKYHLRHNQKCKLKQLWKEREELLGKTKTIEQEEPKKKEQDDSDDDDHRVVIYYEDVNPWASILGGMVPMFR